MTVKLLRLSEMTWVEVGELDHQHTVVFLPISPIEAHGPHLPLGTDLFAARDIAEAAAVLVGAENSGLQAVLAPSLPLGCADVTADFPGTLSLKGRTLYHLVEDLCIALVKSGFKHIVITNHHLDPVHLKALLAAIDAVSARYEVRIIENIGRIVYSGLKTEEIRYGQALGLDMQTEIHADVRETAYILHRYPHLIKTDPKSLPPVPIDVRQGFKKGCATFKEMGAEQGYIGTPGLASADYGRLYLEELARLTADMALNLIEDNALPEIDPRMLKFLKTHVHL